MKLTDLEQRAKAGDPEDMANLATQYLNQNSSRGLWVKAERLLLKAANLGHVRSQLILGLQYEEGRRFCRDLDKSIEWLLKAANQGNTMAQFSLAMTYNFAEAPHHDEVKAEFWYRKAAEYDKEMAPLYLMSMLTKQKLAEA